MAIVGEDRRCLKGRESLYTGRPSFRCSPPPAQPPAPNCNALRSPSLQPASPFSSPPNLHPLDQATMNHTLAAPSPSSLSDERKMLRAGVGRSLTRWSKWCSIGRVSPAGQTSGRPGGKSWSVFGHRCDRESCLDLTRQRSRRS
jgi:hypothetical protein